MKPTYKDAPWLSNLADIKSASKDSLLRSILTADGKGIDFKTAVLEEILSRVELAKAPD